MFPQVLDFYQRYMDLKIAVSRLGLLSQDPKTLMEMMALVTADEENNLMDFDCDDLVASTRVSSSTYLLGEMTKAFDQYVKNHIFTFREWGFVDDNENDRFIGNSMTDVIFAAEKHGFVGFVKEMHETHGCNALCLGGHPRYITSEYFVEDLSRVVDVASREFLILACVDYDPAGAMISKEFQKLLGFFGLSRSRIVNVITLDLLTPQEREIEKYKLSLNSKTQETIAREWLARTGGVDGELYGVESDAFPREAIRQRVAELLKAAGQ